MAVSAEPLVFKAPVVSLHLRGALCDLGESHLVFQALKWINLSGLLKKFNAMVYTRALKSFKWQTLMKHKQAQEAVVTNSTKKKNCLTNGTQSNYELF